jgi:biopolymer transport protein ExbB/TolQ
MTDTSKYLTRMVLFLVVIGVGIAAIAKILTPIFLVNPYLNGVILGVILIGIVLNFRQVALLAPEARWMEDFRNSANRPAEIPAERTDDIFAEAPATTTVADASTLRLLSPMARMLGEKHPRGRLMLSAQATRTLLDTIASRLEESRDIARYLTGLCIFLGLLGTFWGLLGTIKSISDVIHNLSMTSQDIAVLFNSFKKGLEAPLASMSTAFAASLFGLAGSLVLGFLDLQAGQAQNAFFNDLEEWLSSVTRLTSGTGDSEQSVSVYTEALLEQTAERLQDLVTLINRGEQGRVSGNQQFNELNNNLGILADQMRAEQQLMLRMAENQRDLSPVIRGIAESMGHAGTDARAGGGIDEATRNHIRSIDVTLGRLTALLDSSRDDTVREIRAEIKLLARTIAGLGTAPGHPPANRDTDGI